MDSDLRYACVVALGELGRSPDYRDRADAGRGLAGFAELPEAAALLLELVLDPGDTYVTLATAEALFRRKDRSGSVVVASAMAGAGDNHVEWIATAAVKALGMFSDDLDEAVRVCEALLREADEGLSAGARRLLGILAEIDPVLRPA
ncbi:hypothetical protein OH807_35395 [Kitasatospora sp. NBC_01560]|uniref:hypothetical protein n=1 Tax=Kitasatospora sp. NBC_01560 TaxID=2975965 RepID=UPI0038685C0A